MATDLFGWIRALYTKETPEGTPPIFMMHRFMATNKDLAPFCHYLQRDLKDPHLIFRTWQALLPKQGSAPRFGYCAAKKLPEEDELVARVREALGESRVNAERIVELVKLKGRITELYREFGIDTGEKRAKLKPQPIKKQPQGLLARLKR